MYCYYSSKPEETTYIYNNNTDEIIYYNYSPKIEDAKEEIKLPHEILFPGNIFQNIISYCIDENADKYKVSVSRADNHKSKSK